MGDNAMRAHYDFSKMKGRKNPYLKLLKQPVTIRLDRDTVEYFRGLAEKTGLPYQSLINLYLRDCALQRTQLSFRWAAAGRRTRAGTRRPARDVLEIATASSARAAGYAERSALLPEGYDRWTCGTRGFSTRITGGRTPECWTPACVSPLSSSPGI